MPTELGFVKRRLTADPIEVVVLQGDRKGIGRKVGAAGAGEHQGKLRRQDRIFRAAVDPFAQNPHARAGRPKDASSSER